MMKQQPQYQQRRRQGKNHLISSSPMVAGSGCQPPSCFTMSLLCIFNVFLMFTILQVYWFHQKLMIIHEQSSASSSSSSESFEREILRSLFRPFARQQQHKDGMNRNRPNTSHKHLRLDNTFTEHDKRYRDRTKPTTATTTEEEEEEEEEQLPQRQQVPSYSFIPVHLPLQHPLVVVGLPKAGTSSIFEFFECLDNNSSNKRRQTDRKNSNKRQTTSTTFKSGKIDNGHDRNKTLDGNQMKQVQHLWWEGQHWYCCGSQTNARNGGPHFMSSCMMYNLHHNLPILDGCGDYDLYTELNGPKLYFDSEDISNDTSGINSPRTKPKRSRRQRGLFLPQRYHLQDIHEYDPDAIWILNTRPVDDWVESVLHHHVWKDGHSDGERSRNKSPESASRIKIAEEAELNSSRSTRRSNKESLYSGPSSLAKQLIEEVQMQETRRKSSNIAGTPYFVPTPKGRKETQRFLHDLYVSHVSHVQKIAREMNHTLLEIDITSPQAGLDLIDRLGWIDHLHTGANGGPNISRNHGESSGLDDWGQQRSSLLIPRALSCWQRHNEGQYNQDK